MNNVKNKYFFFDKPHLKHLLFLFFFLISIAKNLINDSFDNADNLATPFFKVYIYTISDCLSIIPFIILKARTKSAIMKNHKGHSINDLELIYTNQLVISKKDIKNIILIASADYVAQISMVIYNLIKHEYKLDVKEVNKFIINIQYNICNSIK